jgi:hypothetical protein
MDALVRALEEQTAGAVGLEDIRIDRVFINYLFIFWQDCVHGTATPLLSQTKPQATQLPRRRQRSAPPGEEPHPPAPDAPAPASSVPSSIPADPFAQ